MRRLYISCFLFLVATPLCYGQQPFRFSQYFQNAVTVNPAVAGIEDFMDLKVGYRQQWTGLDLSPQTFYLSAHAPLSAKPSEFVYRNTRCGLVILRLLTNWKPAVRGIQRAASGTGWGDTSSTISRVFFNRHLHLLLTRPICESAAVPGSLWDLSGGLNNRQIDTDGLTVGNPDADRRLIVFLTSPMETPAGI